MLVHIHTAIHIHVGFSITSRPQPVKLNQSTIQFSSRSYGRALETTLYSITYSYTAHLCWP